MIWPIDDVDVEVSEVAGSVEFPGNGAHRGVIGAKIHRSDVDIDPLPS